MTLQLLGVVSMRKQLQKNLSSVRRAVSKLWQSNPYFHAVQSVEGPDVALLEDRVLYSASPLPVELVDAADGAQTADSSTLELYEGLFDHQAAIVEADRDASLDVHDAGALEKTPPDFVLDRPESIDAESRLELVFVDPSAADRDQLVSDLLSQQDESRRFEIIMLDADRDGIEQISDVLTDFRDVNAIHIVSHGSDARVKLGDGWLSLDNVGAYAGQLVGWRDALATDADMLLYGCNLAADEDGKALVQSLSTLCDCDVAASIDDTGHAIFGADWDLEYRTGTIETVGAFSAALQQQWGHLLNVAVDSTSTGLIASGGSTTTFVHNTGSGSDRLMLVGVSFGHGGDTVTSITYNGANLTFIGAQDSGNPRVEIWGLVAPDVGSHNLVVNTTGSSNGVTIGAVTYTGVDQTVAWHGFTSAEGDSSTPSVTTYSAVDELVFGVVGFHNSADENLVPNAGQTERWDLWVDHANGGGTTQAGAASVTTSWSVATSDKWSAANVSIRPVDAPIGNGAIAVWRDNGTNTPQYSLFNGVDFTPEANSVPLNEWQVIQGAEAPTRDEAIVVGVDAGKLIQGEMWDGANWTPLSINDLGSAPSDNYWGFDVAYESNSGDAVLVWADGANLTYSDWDGASWTAPAVVVGYTGADATQMQLAASPDSDAMVLVISDKNKDDWALVWDGTAWGNEIALTGIGSQDHTDVSVIYEQQSGDAMVVYAKDQVEVHYRVWDGVAWSAEGTITAPIGPTGKARWTTLTADPNSDRIGLGVLTESEDAYFAVWDGNNWNATDKLAATSDTNDRNYPNIAITFESDTGQLLATYGVEDTFIRYRTWSAGSGWSGELTGPNLTEKPTSMTLDSDPKSDWIMLSVLDENHDVNYVLWDGTGWGLPRELETDTGQNDRQPFIFVWDQDINDAPVLADTVVTLDAVGEDAGAPSGAVGTLVSNLVDLNPPSGGQDNVTDADKSPQTGVAITAADITNGTWHYSTDGGASWNPLGLVSDASARVLAANTTTRIYFQPNADYNGTIANAITFRAWDQTDGNANGTAGVNTTTNGGKTAYSAATDTASITVNSVNDVPIATADAASVNEDNVLNGPSVLANDSDLHGGAPSENNTPLTAQLVATTSNGTLVLNADGTYTYTPDANFNGADSFTYQAVDSLGGVSNTATATITVNSVNDAPVAADDSGSVNEDDVLTGASVLANDSDLHGGAPNENNTPLTVQLVATTSDGTLVLNADGTYTYTPDADFNGTDSFTYQAVDSLGGVSNATTVTITINPINDAPINSVPAAQFTDTDTPLTFSTGGGNAILIADDSGSGSLQIDLSAINGMLTLNGTSGLTFGSGDGTADASMSFTGTLADINNALDGMIFTPNAGYSGAASVVIKTDDQGNTGAGGAQGDADIVAITVGSSTLTFQQGTAGYFGTEDNELRESDPATAQGNNSSISVDLDNGGGVSQGVIQFDSIFGNGPGQIPWGSTINSANLTVYVFDTSDSGATITMHEMLVGWDESSTWNSLVGGVQLNDAEARSSVDSALTVAEFTGLQTFYGLKSTVQSWSDGGANNGWVIVSDDTDGWDFYSSEYATVARRPILTIDYTAPQPPALDLDADNSSGQVGANFAAAFVEDGGPVAIADVDATLTDADDANLQSLTVTITNLLDGAAESLNANTSGTSISASYDSVTGILSLTGTDTVAHYQQVLRSVTYNNISDTPDETARVIQFVANDGMDDSNVATATVSVTAANDAPVLDLDADDSSGQAGADYAVAFIEGLGPVNVTDSDATLIDVDDASLVSITVTHTNRLDPPSKESLSADTSGTSLTAIWDSGTDTLTISGAGSVADYETVLRRVQYDNTSNNPDSTDRVLTFEAFDGTDTSNIGTTTISFTAVNDPPTTTGIAGVMVDEDAPDTVIDLFAAFDDAEDPDTALTYSITSNTNAALFNATTIDGVAGTLTLDYAANQNGTADITVRATDTSGDFVECTFTMTVNPINDPPTTSGIADVTVDEDAADTVIDLFAAFADIEDADPALTYSITGNTNAALFNATTIDGVAGTLTLDYAANQNGTADITVRATDTSGDFVECTFTVTVNPINDVPTTSGIADVTVDEDSADTVIDLFAAFDDIEDADAALTYSITGNTNVGLFTATTIDGVAGTLTLDYAPDQNGTADITVRATDTSGDFVECTFTVTVNPVNDPPTTSGIADVTVDEDAPDTVIDLFAAFDDIEDADAALTYSITANTNVGLFTATTIDGVAGTLTLDYAPDQNGTADITVRATDTSGDFVECTFTVTVNPVNDPPTTSGIANVTVDEDAPDTLIDLFAAFADIEDADTALTYSITGNTNAALFNATTIDGMAGTLTLDYVPDQNGAADITVRATDTGGDFVECSFTVTVNPVNDAPVLGSNTLTIAEGGTVVLTTAELSATDVDNLNGTLTLTVTNVTNGQFELASNPGVAIGGFTQNQIAAGVIVFVHNGGEAAPSYDVTVSDGALADGPLAAPINFTNVNDAPTASSASFDTTNVEDIVVGAPGLLAGAADAENDPLVAVLVDAPAHGSVTINADGSFTYVPNANYVGDDTFTFVVSDGVDSSSVETVTIAIDAGGGPSDPGDGSPDDGGGSDDDPTDPHDDTPSVGISPHDIPSDGTDPAGTHSTARRHLVGGASDVRAVSIANVALTLPDVFDTGLPDGDALLRTLQRVAPQNVGVAAASAAKAAAASAANFVLDTGLLWDQLDELREQFDSDVGLQDLLAGSATVAAATFSAGFVFWVLRGGYFLSLLLTSMPAWRYFDPLPIFDGRRDRKDGESEDAQTNDDFFNDLTGQQFAPAV